MPDVVLPPDVSVHPVHGGVLYVHRVSGHMAFAPGVMLLPSAAPSVPVAALPTPVVVVQPAK
jgi:hypothetical protein